jgi:hypothetical protein
MPGCIIEERGSVVRTRTENGSGDLRPRIPPRTATHAGGCRRPVRTTRFRSIEFRRRSKTKRDGEQGIVFLPILRSDVRGLPTLAIGTVRHCREHDGLGRKDNHCDDDRRKNPMSMRTGHRGGHEGHGTGIPCIRTEDRKRWEKRAGPPDQNTIKTATTAAAALMPSWSEAKIPSEPLAATGNTFDRSSVGMPSRVSSCRSEIGCSSTASAPTD